MFQNVFYILPSIVCVSWAAIFCLSMKNKTQKLALHILGIAAIYFFLYTLIFTPGVDYGVVCNADVLVIPVSLALLASLVVFVNSHMKRKIVSNSRMQWLYFPALAEGGIVAALYYIIGFDNIASFFDAVNSESAHWGILPKHLPAELNTPSFRIFYLFDTVILNILLAIMALLVFIVCVIAIKRDGYRFADLFRWFFKGTEVNPVRVIALIVMLIVLTTLPLSLLGRSYIIQHPFIGYVVSVLVAVEIFILCYCELVSDIKMITLHDLTHIYFTVRKKSDADDETSAMLTSLRAIERNNELNEELRRLFEEEKIWLDADLKMVTLAEQLNTNRNKLSMVFNQIYGKDFKTLVAELRVEEAKRLMKKDPSATMEYVALHSGFREPTTNFFRRFKEIVGMTPTEWKLVK